MASVHRNLGRSRYWLAVFTGPSKERIHLSKKFEDKLAAEELADELEKAARWARLGSLTQEKVQSIIGACPPMYPEVETKVRKLLNEFLLHTGADAIAETTVRQWCHSWLANQSGATSEGTAKRYAVLIRDFLLHLEAKADQSLRRLSIMDVQNFRDEEVKLGKASSTVNLAIKTLRTCFDSAVHHGYCNFNRAKGIRTRHATKSSAKKFKKKPFSLEQVEALIANAPTREWQELIISAYYIGDRLGNLVKLRIEDFDLAQEKLTYTPGKQKVVAEEKTVTIPLHPALTRLVKGQKRTTGPLFPTLSKKPVSGVGGLSLKFRKIMDAAGIECEVKKAGGPSGRAVYSLSFHSLRRSFNSSLANADVPQELRQQLIGHASKEINDPYTTVEMQTLRDAVNRLPELNLKLDDQKPSGPTEG